MPEYTAAMPVDIAAEVIGNDRLSADYNVVRMSAPAIAAAAAPGQFVMVKAGRGHDPLLRRPFSVFEVLRDTEGTPQGISLLNKRIGVSTTLLYDSRAGQHIDCLGPLGRPFTIVEAPAAGRFAADALVSIGTPVRSGQPLGRLEPRLSTGGEDRATLAAEVARAQAALEAARTEEGRAERLLAEQAVPARRVEDARRGGFSRGPA